MSLAILLVFCLFYKIIVSCFTKCVTEPQIKLTKIWRLETIDQIYSSIRPTVVIVLLLDMGRGNKREPFPGP